MAKAGNKEFDDEESMIWHLPILFLYFNRDGIA
jgi:hypothetical protein